MKNAPKSKTGRAEVRGHLPAFPDSSKNYLSRGAIAENFVGIGPVSRAMIHARACELAMIEGHVRQITQNDYEQAKRELSGDSGIDRREASLESIPEEERWDPVPGSAGHQVPDTPDEDEDDEGLNEIGQLVAEGVAEAEHDQMLEAARAAAKSD
jgi:hypothetical protein